MTAGGNPAPESYLDRAPRTGGGTEQGPSLPSVRDPPSEGGETPRKADFYRVPLRTYLWLAVPAAIGAVVGLGLAHRSAVHGTAVRASAPLAHDVRCCSVVSSPERVYRPAHPHIGLTPLKEALATAKNGVAATSASVTAPKLKDNSIIQFTTNPR